MKTRVLREVSKVYLEAYKYFNPEKHSYAEIARKFNVNRKILSRMLRLGLIEFGTKIFEYNETARVYETVLNYCEENDWEIKPKYISENFVGFSLFKNNMLKCGFKQLNQNFCRKIKNKNSRDKALPCLIFNI